MKYEINKGTILNLLGSWSSGLAKLTIRDSKTGELQVVPCENAQTVRALDSAFGDVITKGHCANGNGFEGKEIFWSWDEMGIVLGGFTPAEGASIELEEKYQAQFKCKKNKKQKKI